MPSEKADNPVNIRPARKGELAELSLLCLRSKAVWGYSPEFLAACRPGLTLAPDDLPTTFVAERKGHPIGVAQIVARGGTAVLEKLFVEPHALRTGVGRTLLEFALRNARDRGAAELVIESDPDAAGFFLAMGAKAAGDAASNMVPGRRLPRFVVRL